MRTITNLASAVLAAAPFLTGVASADDRLHLTPPLYREQARATQQVRPGSELTTTPQLVPPSPASGTGQSAVANKLMIEASAR